MKNKIEVFIDGSSRGNPGDGGFGVVFIYNNVIIGKISEQHKNVTNNRMELLALLTALEYIKENNIDNEYIIYSDSLYVVRSCNEWMSTWAKNNWINSKKQTVENVDLMQLIYKHIQEDSFIHSFEIVHIKGHSGNPGNEMADALATGNIKKFEEIRVGYDFEYEDIDD